MSSTDQIHTILRDYPYLFQGTLNKFFTRDLLKLERPKQNPNFVKINQINTQGDIISHLGKPAPEKPEESVFQRFYKAPFTPETLSYLKRKVPSLNKRGITVYWMFPPIPKRDYLKDQRLVDPVYEALQEIPDLMLLGTPQESTYPIDDFFDSGVHLAEEARDTYTLEIARKFLNQNRAPNTSASSGD